VFVTGATNGPRRPHRGADQATDETDDGCGAGEPTSDPGAAAPGRDLGEAIVHGMAEVDQDVQPGRRRPEYEGHLVDRQPGVAAS